MDGPFSVLSGRNLAPRAGGGRARGATAERRRAIMRTEAMSFRNWVNFCSGGVGRRSFVGDVRGLASPFAR